MPSRPVRVLMVVSDTDLARMLRDHLASRGYELIEPAQESDVRAMVTEGSADLLLCEAEILRQAEIPPQFPTICLATMGASRGGGERLRVLTKPASLKAIERALAELVAG